MSSSPVSVVPDTPLRVEHASCPLCGGQAEPFLTDTHDLHYGIEGRWNYERCRDCRVVFLNPAPTVYFLSSAYDDSYYSYQEFKVPGFWQTLVRRLLIYDTSATGDPKFAKPGRVLDIGCGSGVFLYKMKRSGWETHGVEPSAKAAQLGNGSHDLHIQAGTLADATLQEGYFDYIRLNHSFEHILDPRETLGLIYRYLAPDGRLFIGVPNVDSVPARLFGKRWWNLGPPVHPFNYSRTTLTRLLGEHGFDVVSYRTNSNFAGLLGSLQMTLNDRNGIRADDGVLFRNPIAKVLTHWLSKFFDLFAVGDCLEIVARKRRPAGRADA